MQKFVMVPAETVKPGDLVAPAGTPVRDAMPLAEVNRLDDSTIELVFIEKSLYSDVGIRAAVVVRPQFPVALVCDVDNLVDDVIRDFEKLLARSAGQDS